MTLLDSPPIVRALPARAVLLVMAFYAALSASTLAIARAAPGAPQPASPSVPGPVPAPEDDPLLAPPPPAPRTIASWDEALTLIRAQSPDYLDGGGGRAAG